MAAASGPSEGVWTVGAALEVVLADPAAPAGFAPCTWLGVPPSRREVWSR